jgi:hypothetical protein
VKTEDDLRSAYFSWLYFQNFRIWDEESHSSYVIVCEHLHGTEFNDSLPNDDNRAADGAELREEFLREFFGTEDADEQALAILNERKASVFEMMVALSRRADFIARFGPAWWFRTFLENLGLIRFPDSLYTPRDEARIERIIGKLNNRMYAANGRGGLFPLRRSRRDQRENELWWQMHEYTSENRMY